MRPHGRVAIVVGSAPPAMSISWQPPTGPADSGFIVFFADLLPDDPGFDDLPVETVCLGCLVDDGDRHLAEGLDLARSCGWSHIEWDPDLEDWCIPGDARRVRS